MRIGEVSERLGINPKTIRFYESIGLIPEPRRTPAGYRDYDEEDVERLEFVKAAQRLGLRLEDIGEIIAFRETGQQPCDYVISLVRRELTDLGKKMEEMRRLQGELDDLMDRAEELRGLAGYKYCPIISHHGGSPEVEPERRG